MFLSIITVNYNNAHGLLKTMESVFVQSFRDFEFLVIDGGSTDGSTAMLADASGKIDYYISEPDNGIYHAMNKGIVKAQGEYLLFLNSGDFLVNKDSLSHFFKGDHSYDIICADMEINENGKKWIKQAPEIVTFHYMMQDTLPHQSGLIRRSLFDKIGLYAESLRLVADWKFYMDALCKHGATYLHLPVVTTEYDFGGISSVSENAAQLHAERRKVLEEEYPMFYQDYQEFAICRATLRNYQNSRAHQLVSGILGGRLFKFLKKKS